LPLTQLHVIAMVLGRVGKWRENCRWVGYWAKDAAWHLQDSASFPPPFPRAGKTGKTCNNLRHSIASWGKTGKSAGPPKRSCCFYSFLSLRAPSPSLFPITTPDTTCYSRVLFRFSPTQQKTHQQQQQQQPTSRRKERTNICQKQHVHRAQNARRHVKCPISKVGNRCSKGIQGISFILVVYLLSFLHLT